MTIVLWVSLISIILILCVTFGFHLGIFGKSGRGIFLTSGLIFIIMVANGILFILFNSSWGLLRMAVG